MFSVVQDALASLFVQQILLTPKITFNQNFGSIYCTFKGKYLGEKIDLIKGSNVCGE